MLARLTLTVRLTVFYTLVSAVVLSGLGVLMALATYRHFIDLDRIYLQDKAQLIQKFITETPQAQLLVSRLDELRESHHDLHLQLRRGDGEIVYGGEDISFPDGLAASETSTTTPFDWRDGTRQLRGISLELDGPTAPGSLVKEGQKMRLLVALDTLHHTHFMADLLQTLVLYLLAATLLSGMLGWWAARSGLAPLRIMKERAMVVTAHKLDQRMPVDAVPVEMADLAQSLNTMLERLETDFSRLLEFSGDLAHELRTPISNLLTQTQVSLAQQRDAAAYREILASNAEEFQRLARMVSDMLFLAKAENGLALPHREAISLEREVQALFDFYDAVADEKGVHLRLSGRANVAGDRLMIRRAISNLLSNAVRHAPAGSAVEVTIAQDEGVTALCVSNAGAPIDVAQLPRLFDRFYRVDKSRAHPESDGTGLGLSITRAIMVAHGGTASVSSGNGRITFCLRFSGQSGRAQATFDR